MPGDAERSAAALDRDTVEVPLQGGRATTGVVRVGQTVRRPSGPWTPAVHAFLRHLHQRGFHAAPRPLGMDDRGREILTYLPGVTLFHGVDVLEADDDIARVARLVRDLHVASAGFVLPTGSSTRYRVTDPAGGTLVVHNDLAPWNVVVDVAHDTWAIIDWDGISFGRREWDLAYVLHTFVPLWPTADLSDERTASRLSAFADGYGMDASLLAASVRLAPERCRAVAQLIEAEAAAGDPAFMQIRDDGDVGDWRAAADHIEERAPTWLRLCRRRSAVT